MSQRASFLDLADFLGLTLELSKTSITGKGAVRQDWGLIQHDIKQQVFSSLADQQNGVWLLLIASAGDLGLLIDYEVDSGLVEVCVLDRSLVPNRGKDVFSSTTLRAIDAVPHASIKAKFMGPIRGPLEATV